MNKVPGFTTLICVLLLAFNSHAQERLTTFGIQFKPIISSEIINTGPQIDKIGDIGFRLEQDGGYSFGMVIRKGFTKQLSLETGINFSKRNYSLTITEDSTGFRGTSGFSYTIYEIPVLGLVYVQLGRQSYMNAAFGASFNFLPSDWDSFDTYFQHYSARQSWIVPSLLANMGFEYRTADKGFFYVGFSYHRPFSRITNAGFRYLEEGSTVNYKEQTFFDVSGNYLTIDLRYFFHEDPEKPKNRRR